MANIDLKERDKAEVLADLYNASQPLGMGFLQYMPARMTDDEARSLLDSGQTYFDYLKGRVMKVDLGGDEFDPWLYDRDNGEGAAENAILRGTLRRIERMGTEAYRARLQARVAASSRES